MTSLFVSSTCEVSEASELSEDFDASVGSIFSDWRKLDIKKSSSNKTVYYLLCSNPDLETKTPEEYYIELCIAYYRDGAEFGDPDTYMISKYLSNSFELTKSVKGVREEGVIGLGDTIFYGQFDENYANSFSARNVSKPDCYYDLITKRIKVVFRTKNGDLAGDVIIKLDQVGGISSGCITNLGMPSMYPYVY